MSPGLRRFALTAHITSSVGWLGTVATFLALAVVGLTNQDATVVRAAYLAAESITWYVIVPLAFASLLTGLVMSLGTPWGLFRHYWVLVKFLLTVLATVLLLLHTQPIGQLAAIARWTIVSGADAGRLQIQLVADAAAALVALLVNVTLSVYKPRGVTAYGQRKLVERPDSSDATRDRGGLWLKVFAAIVVTLVLLFVILHLTGRGLGALHH